jgi:transcriptional regulator with XRE-family HTH domain
VDHSRLYCAYRGLAGRGSAEIRDPTDGGQEIVTQSRLLRGPGNHERSFNVKACSFGLPKVGLMASIGARLRAIRQQLQLSLREVEKNSRRIARDRGDSSYQLSTSWLARLERYDLGFTVNKLLALAEIYKIPIDQLLRADYPKKGETPSPDQLSGPNATELPTAGVRKASAKRSGAARQTHDPLPDETTLLATDIGPSRTLYARGIIGKLDSALDPMIPAGSIVQIDKSRREIATKQAWTHEFQRPICFLKTKDGYLCGWCELDEDSHLTLIPHPRSSASSRRWKYGTEVEILGRVVAVTIGLGMTSTS